jgi:UDP-2-acetamido-3-amino-2,3-dideoxy-glucuronate N-acetyltransferase
MRRKSGRASRPEPGVRVMPGADVDPRARIGPGASVWHLAQIREDAEIGAGCVIGRGAYIGPGARLGRHCKVQNYALVYEPAWLEDGVFVGPAAIFTNDRYPRAVTPDGSIKTAGDWEPVGVTVRCGASIGAAAVCVAPVTVGRWAVVAAGSVVVKDVPDFALVAGAPARFVRWVGRAGVALAATSDGRFRCPRTGAGYVRAGDILREETS